MTEHSCVASRAHTPWVRTRLLACALGLGLVASSPVQSQRLPANRGSDVVTGEIRGRIVVDRGNRALTGTSVTVRRSDDSSFAGGALVAADGSFRVEGLRMGRYFIRLRALGYLPSVRSDILVSSAQRMVDLGTLPLSAVAASLDHQLVTAERGDVTLAPDRNSYSTKNMIAVSGGTAVDVLRNVPAVDVGGSNKVTLRGNENVVVQINGRASPLKGEHLSNFLAQLPASMIKLVEVATNPSAKSDPEGTAGIINIVLNQDAEIGVSAGINASTGTTGLASISANVGRQTGPLTLFLSGSLYRDERGLSGITNRTNLVDVTPAFTDSRLDGSVHPRSQGITARSEYRLTGKDAVSFDALTYFGSTGRSNDSRYYDLDASRSVIGISDHGSDQEATNQSRDYALSYRRSSTPTLVTLLSELRYSRVGTSNEADLMDVVRQSDSVSATMPREHLSGRSIVPTWSLQTDYTRPFGTGAKLEAGVKGTRRTTWNYSATSTYDPAMAMDPAGIGHSAEFTYEEQIVAGYAVLSRQVRSIQAQAGLRLEEVSTRSVLPPNLQPRQTRYGSAFPSAILTYSLGDTRRATASYSRRVTRPNPYQLSAIEYRENSRNIYHGNAGLQPEYTDAIELVIQETRAWGSVQATEYRRKTAHAMRFIQTVDTAGRTVGTYDNVATTNTMGSEVNITYRHAALTLFANANVFRYVSDASNLADDLSTRGVAWSTRTNASWKANTLTDVQVLMNYRAASATEGGTQAALVSTTVAVRRKLWGERGSMSLRCTDPFNVTKFGTRTAIGNVIELSERRNGQRGIFFSVSRTVGRQLTLKSKLQDADVQTSGGS